MIGLGDLECHFNWKPEQNSVRDDIEELTFLTEQKCKEYREGITAYRCIIGYLNAVPGPQVDYSKSFDEFTQLLDSFEILDDFRCDFIVRANKLFLEVQKLKTKDINSEEVKQEMLELSTLWKQPRVKMKAYLIKGLTFISFAKFELSCNAFKQALQLTSEVECSIHQRFIVVSGYAYALAEMMRQTSREVLTEDETKLWREAFQILEENESLDVNKALFLSQYAFALSDIDEKKKLVEDIFDIIQANDQSIFSMPTMKCIRLTKRTKQTDIRDALIRKLWERPENLQRGNCFYEVSKVYSFTDPDENAKAIEILKAGKEAAVIGKRHVFSTWISYGGNGKLKEKIGPLGSIQPCWTSIQTRDTNHSFTLEGL